MEEETTKLGRYHVADYVHVYRKINKSMCRVSNTNKKFLQIATDTCHMAPSNKSFKETMNTILNDLRNCGEIDEVDYLTRSGTGFSLYRPLGYLAYHHLKTCDRWGVTSCSHASVNSIVGGFFSFTEIKNPIKKWMCG